MRMRMAEDLGVMDEVRPEMARMQGSSYSGCGIIDGLHGSGRSAAFKAGTQANSPVLSREMGWKLELDAISARASPTESAINSCERIAAFKHYGSLQLLVLRAGSSQTKSHRCAALLGKCGHRYGSGSVDQVSWCGRAHLEGRTIGPEL